ncbi:MAG: glycosyltransferase family 4 protein [Anaerolineae bacterium]
MKRIAICVAQIPFVRGGAEIHVESLARELRRRGFEVDIVSLPFKEYPRSQLLKSCLIWHLIDLTESGDSPIDLVIATKFPSYVVRHPNKVTWLIHQYRQVYDLFGTEHSDFTNLPEDRRFRAMIRRIDNESLAESQRIFTNARNTASRLARFNGLHGEPLYHPPKHDGRYRNDGYGDYVFAVSRLDPLKRLDDLVRAMAHTRPDVQCRIAGTGPMEHELRRLAVRLGVRDRVEFLGYVDDDQLIDLYANCFAVYYAPYDEDYGYVTLEALKSRKPVLTAPDSGAVLEFVEDGEDGFVIPLDQPAIMGERIDQLYADARLAARLGDAGHARVEDITWDYAIERLTETL